jgi:peptidoglycan/LPS O-acetylase OafA/YrhL
MVTFAPWLYMFLVGAWLSTRADVTAAIRRVSPAFFVAVFALCTAATWAAGLPLGTNSINPLMFAAMAALIIRLAYAKPKFSGILRGVDISYGLYIYHMPVFNLLLWAGLVGSFAAGALGCVIVVGLAAASWFAIERPALSFVHSWDAKPRKGHRQES